MSNEEKKKNLIALINDMELEDDLKRSLTDFLDSYNGSNFEQLFKMFEMLIMEFLALRMFKTKARGYDIMKISYDDFMNQVEQIKADFAALEQGKYPNRSEVSDVDDEDVDDEKEGDEVE
jgi:hypothetical protein